MYKQPTTAEYPERRSVVFLDPLISLPDQHPDGGRGRVEVCDLQSLHHLPVPPCTTQHTVNDVYSDVHVCMYKHSTKALKMWLLNH